MPPVTPPPERPDESLIRRHLEKILSSGVFRAGTRRQSQRPIRLLRFIVEEKLAGRHETLKEYRIGLDVFDRPDNFNPQTDAIVRLEAGRLRTRLDAYYQSEGTNDAVKITIPKGGYVPDFLFASGRPPEPSERSGYSDTDRRGSLDQFKQACQHQVRAELSAMVGRKYMPALYVPRKLERLLRAIIAPDRFLRRVRSTLAHFYSEATSLDTPAKLLAHISALQGEPRTRFRNITTSTLRSLPDSPLGRLHILTGPAGIGKTNLLSHLALALGHRFPTVFLTGRSGITERTSIMELVEVKLRRHMSDWPPALDSRSLGKYVQTLDTNLVIIVDAINEHRDIDVITTALGSFLVDIQNLPVICIASCRDAYWPFFDATPWRGSQWARVEPSVSEFVHDAPGRPSRRRKSEAEVAIEGYFSHYRLSATLSVEAKRALRHPLLLRFFCETYGDSAAVHPITLGPVNDVRTKHLFDEFLKRKARSLRFAAPTRWRTEREAERVLLGLAAANRSLKDRAIPLAEVSEIVGRPNVDALDSVYSALLNEDLIKEERDEQGNVTVLFSYDLFMEYMIARSMLLEVAPITTSTLQALGTECQNTWRTFRSMLGVLEYLMIIAREEFGVEFEILFNQESDITRIVVLRAIANLAPELVGPGELSMIDRCLMSRGDARADDDRSVRLFATETLDLDVQLTVAEAIRCWAVLCAQRIVDGSRYVEELKSAAIGLLARSVREEENVWIRHVALRFFLENNRGTVSDGSKDVCEWWNEAIKGMAGAKVLVAHSSPILRDGLCRLWSLEGWAMHQAGDALRIREEAERVQPRLIIGEWDRPELVDAIASAKPALSPHAEVLLLSEGEAYGRQPSPSPVGLVIWVAAGTGILVELGKTALVGRMGAANKAGC